MIEPTNTEGYFGSKDQHAAWVVESIWGHRLETQPPPAMLLEFLGMAEGMHRQGKLLEHTTPGGNHEYTAYQSLQLRNILFNNPRMEEIQRDSQGNDSEAWTKWLNTMTNGASTGLRLKPDFAYLRKRFDRFDDLVAVVKLLRRIVMSSGTDSKWTTQFLFPIGTAAYYDALTQKGEGFERDRSVFTRTGEIAYLMLTRSAEHLRLGIRQRFEALFSRDTDRNRLLMLLISSDTPDCGDPKSGTYLPHKTHPAFDRFAEDVLALLSLDLQNQDIHQHLPLLISFHVYLYAIETANHWIGKPTLPSIVCEILAPQSNPNRREVKHQIEKYLPTSSVHLQQHRELISIASVRDRMQRNLPLLVQLIHPYMQRWRLQLHLMHRTKIHLNQHFLHLLVFQSFLRRLDRVHP